MPTLADARRAALAVLRPPPKVDLSTWIESHLVLPDDVSSTPGKVRLWPWQVGIADAISDPTIEKLTIARAK